MKKTLKKISQNTLFGFDFSGKCGILCTIGCGNPYEAGAAAVKGGDLQKFYGDSVFESAGRTLCDATSYAFTTPAGSFFVPGVVTGGKSHQDLIRRRLELCKTILRTVNRTLFSPIFTATTPPGVCPNSPQFRSTTPEPIL
jgi:hypothetical protein